jgi:DegV family protein with EDD domain
MQQPNVYDEGYDSLDVNTRAAIAFVERNKPKSDIERLAQLAPTVSPAVARMLIVVDTACDLPQAWLSQHAVVVMPRLVRIGDREILETRDNENAYKLFEHLAAGGESSPQSNPLAPAAMRNELHQWLSAETDAVLQICLSARRSRMYVNALAATQSLVLIHNKVRRLSGTRAPLTAWVIDSANALGGIGVLLAHAVRLRATGMLPANIAVTLNTFRNSIHTLVAVHDMTFITRSARVIEKRSVPRWKIGLAVFFDFKPILHLCADRVDAIARVRGHAPAMNDVLSRAARLVTGGALTTPFVALSYAGKLDEVERLEEYKVLRTLCNRHQVEISLTPMSMSGALMLGPRALAVSFASQQFKP